MQYFQVTTQPKRTDMTKEKVEGFVTRCAANNCLFSPRDNLGIHQICHGVHSPTGFNSSDQSCESSLLQRLPGRKVPCRGLFWCVLHSTDMWLEFHAHVVIICPVKSRSACRYRCQLLLCVLMALNLHMQQPEPTATRIKQPYEPNVRYKSQDSCSQEYEVDLWSA